MDACEEIAHSSILHLIKLACGQVSVACNALCNLEKNPSVRGPMESVSGKPAVMCVGFIKSKKKKNSPRHGEPVTESLSQP